MELRPKVEEVVTHLGEAAAGWGGLMPPGSGPNKMLNSKKLSESEDLILPLLSTIEKRNRQNLSTTFESHRTTSHLRPNCPSKRPSHPVC